MLKPVVATTALIATLLTAPLSLSAEFKELPGAPSPSRTPSVRR